MLFFATAVAASVALSLLALAFCAAAARSDEIYENDYRELLIKLPARAA